MLKSLVRQLLITLGVVVILFALLPVICLVFSIDMAELMRSQGGIIVALFTALPASMIMLRAQDSPK